MTDYVPGADTAGPDGAYRYGNTRPLTVFLLALIAALAAIAVVYGAWAGLNDATQSQRLAEPPDLKGVVAHVSQSRELVHDLREDLGRKARETDISTGDSTPAARSAE